MAWRGASLHQKSPCVGEVLKRRNTAKASSARQTRSHHFELDDRPSDEWCIFTSFYFIPPILILAALRNQITAVSTSIFHVEMAVRDTRSSRLPGPRRFEHASLKATTVILETSDSIRSRSFPLGKRRRSGGNRLTQEEQNMFASTAYTISHHA